MNSSPFQLLFMYVNSYESNQYILTTYENDHSSILYALLFQSFLVVFSLTDIQLYTLIKFISFKLFGCHVNPTVTRTI